MKNKFAITPIKYSTAPLKSQQRGAMSLLISLVILVLITFVSLYTAHTVSMEQKITGNEFRSRQSFEAAEAGLRGALTYLRNGIDRNDDGLADTNVFISTGVPPKGTAGTQNSMTFGDGSTVTTSVSGAAPQFTVISVGRSADRSATRTVSTIATILEPVPNVPDNPLTTRGAVVIAGSATVHNAEGTSTIWSGGDIDLGSNNSTKTEIASPADSANYPDCYKGPDIADRCEVVQTSDQWTTGVDVIEHDSSLANLSGDEFFVNFFGMDKDTYKDTMADIVITDPDNNYGNDYHTDDPPGADHATNAIVYVDGDVTGATGITLGCTVTAASHSPTDVNDENCQDSAGGTGELKPSILIIDGDLELTGGSVFLGLVFVTGNLKIGGNNEVQGAMVVGGEATQETGGSLDIWYDSSILNGLNDSPPATSAAGAWRDFLL